MNGKLLSSGGVFLFLVWFLSSEAAQGQPFPTNNNPANQIRFDTPAEADARRSTLVNYIWSGGLPTTTPTVVTGVPFPTLAVGIDPGNVARVDRLNANVSGWGYNANSYLMHPTNTTNANRLVIVHQGHADDLFGGVGATANHLLEQGFTVLAMKMPLTGLSNWSNDTTAFIPGFQGFRTYSNHGDMIYNTGPSGGGQGFRFFLEPVVQGINYAVASIEGLTDISMVGLSGGGWTTSLMAAIDPRITTSIPVAGSAPLYRRNADPGAVGDPEQYYEPLYNENILPNGSGGGIATWLEIYALGGYGEGRRQIQVTNQFDNCCFAGTFPNDFKNIVADRVELLGSGQWEHVIDSTHHVHQISSHILKTVVSPALGITAPTPNSLPIVDDFANQSSGMPGGWSIDPSSGASTTAVENGGKVTISGTSLDSIVYNAPFNSQLNHPITITLGIESMTNDNFMGVFLTDNIGSRGFHLGPLFNAASRQVVLNADNGAGFNASQDRITLGTVPGYSGGAAVMTLTFDSAGFAVKFDAGAAGSYSSGMRSWSQIPGGFDPTKLGEQTQLFIQSFDVNGGTPANVVIDYVSVETTFLAGDFNGDGAVDATDYIVWRNAFGTSTTPWRGADANGDGTVDTDDYLVWKTNFGQTNSAAALTQSPAASIPEPAGWTFLVTAALLLSLGRLYFSSASVLATQ